MNTASPTGSELTTSPPLPPFQSQWAGLAGRANGHESAPGRSFVFLHGLTFDCRMWDPILGALGPDHRTIAFDLPGHGASSALAQPCSAISPIFSSTR